jgi:ribosome-binding protein aMBF1 (putative translation factor)
MSVFQDWQTVGWDKRGEKPRGVSETTFKNNEIRSGRVASSLKTVPMNQNKVNVVTNIKKIENETETFKHKTVGKEVAKRITEARLEKKLTQKQFAALLCLPFATVKTFENGTAIYNAEVLNKMGRCLGKNLRI